MTKNNLVEIKKNQTGTGLLIENDGYISMDKGHNKTIKEEFENNGEWHVPYPFIVDAVFQKYDIKNANGRIYPEETLKREVEKYQQLINTHMAYGECYTPDVLILTEKGWKKLADVIEGENILTLNTDTNEIEVKPILRKIEKDYKGDLIRIHQRTIDDSVTPNHEYILYNRNNKFQGRYKAIDLYNGTIKGITHSYIPKKGKWIGADDEFMTIPNLSEKRINEMHVNVQQKYLSDLKIPMKLFAAFMGIYLSEGWCDKKEDACRVEIYQRKKDVTEKIDKLLSEIGISYSKKDNISKEDDKSTTTFTICDMRLCKYLQQFGLCYDKFVPYEIKRQNSETLKIFYDWFVLGDGRIRGDKRDKNRKLTDDVFSTSKQLALDLNEIQLKIGASGTFHEENRKKDRYINERLIKAENSHNMYFSLKSTSDSIYLDKRFTKYEKVPYEGKVMCVEVDNHSWYVMSNGKCHWTSNCNHPSESTIDLGRISHNIIELHWEGHTLVGKMELNISEGYRKFGICSTLGDTVANLLLNGYKIGVSSRGVGSVENKLGTYIVGNDFELICWDVVSSPSTPGAYISVNGKENLRPYMENNESKKEKPKLNEKLLKIQNILNS